MYIVGVVCGFDCACERVNIYPMCMRCVDVFVLMVHTAARETPTLRIGSIRRNVNPYMQAIELASQILPPPHSKHPIWKSISEPERKTFDFGGFTVNLLEKERIFRQH